MLAALLSSCEFFSEFKRRIINNPNCRHVLNLLFLKSLFLLFYFLDCRTHRNYLALAVNEYGRKSPSFVEASKIAAEILSLGDFDSGEIHFNRFR